jgi:hypothetical protein
MTQVNIKKLDSLTHNDSAATKLINDNFKAIEKALESSLSRVPGVPNYMDTDLDMNTKKIINVKDPVTDSDVANKRYIDKVIGNAKEYAQDAKGYADKAKTYAEYVQITNKHIQDKTSEANEIYKDIVEISDNISVKEKYTPFNQMVLLSKDTWGDDVISGRNLKFNQMEFSIRDLLKVYDVKNMTAFVGYLTDAAFDGSYLNYARVYRLDDKVICKVYKTGDAPATDIYAFVTIFYTLGEKM